MLSRTCRTLAAMTAVMAMTTVIASHSPLHARDTNEDAPRVVLLDPETGSVVSGKKATVKIEYQRGRNRLRYISFFIDNACIDPASGPIDMSSAERGEDVFDLDTTKFSDGIHRFTVRLVDEAGMFSTHSAIVFVANRMLRLTPPVVEITTVFAGQTVRGRVPIGVRAASDGGVRWVVLFVNNKLDTMKNLTPENRVRDTLYQCELMWDTTSLSNGSYVIYVKAMDFFRNEGISERIRVIVNNLAGETDIQTLRNTRGSDSNSRENTLVITPNGRPSGTLMNTAPKREAGPAASVHPSDEGEALSAEGTTLIAFGLPSRPGITAPDGSMRFIVLPPKTTALEAGIIGPASTDIDPGAPHVRLVDVGPGLSPPTMDMRTRPRTTEKVLIVDDPVLANLLNQELSSVRRTGGAPSPSSDLPPSGTRGTGRGPSVSASRSEVNPASASSEVRLPRTPAASQGAATPPDFVSRSLSSGSSLTTTAADGSGKAIPVDLIRIKLKNQGNDNTTVVTAPETVATRPETVRAAAILTAMLQSSQPINSLMASRYIMNPTQMSAESTPPLARIAVTTSSAISRVSSLVMHVVKPGESVAGLARTYGVTRETIVAANSLVSPAHLAIGQTLQIPRYYTASINGKELRSDVKSFATPAGPAAPFRAVVEGVGGKVSWQPKDQLVTASALQNNIALRVGQREAKVNERKVMMDFAAMLMTGRTMVPVSFFRIALNATVMVDPATGSITINTR